ncbi:MAG TPA: NUDIX domain-containing protein [Anaerolineales bacterium]|nr:NUDIX domain-containing protein [Anaerolineales bacterium]
MKFHYLARGIVYINGMVLLAHQKGAEHTFLPGGHIGMGEKAEAALLREIEEEIGEKVAVKRFIGAVEAAWSENGQDHHEINLVFEVDIPNLDSSEPPRSLEEHLEFRWAAPAELKVQNLLPEPMVECLVNLDRGYHGFWGSSIE